MKNYAFIGCGMMGQEHLRNLALLDGACVTGIYEPDDTMAERALALAPNAVRLASVDAVIGSGPDAVVITSPNFVHANQLRALADTDISVLVEKPLCTDPADLDPLVDLAHDRLWWVAMEYRYMPPIARLIDIVRSQQLGHIHSLSIREHRFPFCKKSVTGIDSMKNRRHPG